MNFYLWSLAVFTIFFTVVGYYHDTKRGGTDPIVAYFFMGALLSLAWPLVMLMLLSEESFREMFFNKENFYYLALFSPVLALLFLWFI